MDIEQDWRSFEPEDKDLEQLFDKLNVSELHSNNVLTKIRKSLFTSTVISVPLTIAFIVLIIFTKVPEAKLLLLVAAGGCVWSIAATIKLYYRIGTGVSADNTLLQQLKQDKLHIERYISIQEKGSVFIYPFSISGGYLLGAANNMHKTVAEVLAARSMLTMLVFAILILTPVCYIIVHYAFKYMFGKHLKMLGSIIRQLEEE